jgi:oligopeptide/dipeptide ABC transporter ATP-binding protein
MIEVEGLQKTYYVKSGLAARTVVPAVRDVSFELADGGAISLIGESGCGKTTIGRMLCGLETPTAGTIRLDGRDIRQLRRKERTVSLQRIQLIHQDPYQALNPAHTIQQILAAPLKMMARRKGVGVNWIQERMKEVLTIVGLDPATVLYKYPHMLSGGQRQRVVIARALTVEPRVLVADEAVSMIDVSLRLGILKLLRDLRETYQISLLFITHDVAAARYLGPGSQIYVIYKGLVVEKGETDEVIQHPHHPYTQALLSAVPVLRGLEKPGPERFVIKREMRSGEPEASGCLFADRCPFVQKMCRDQSPGLSGSAHDYACHFPQERQVTAVSLDH